MKILVTGGGGLIGRNLLRVLLERNHSCVIIDDLSSGSKKNIPKSDSIVFYQGSVSDSALLKKIFCFHEIEAVFHLATFFANQNSVDHPDKDLITNGLGILNTLEVSLKHNVKKFIYTSSSCVYGSICEMNEKTILPIGNLDTPYAITKLLGEQYCKYYAKQHNLNTVCARLFNSYGPGELPGKYRNVIPNFIDKAIKKESLVITGSGDETRDFTFVEDTVLGLVAMLEHETTPGDVFNLGSGKSTTILTLARKINEITSNSAPIVFQEKRIWDDIDHRVSSIGKAKKTFNYQSNTTLDDGLKLTYEWLKTQDE